MATVPRPPADSDARISFAILRRIEDSGLASTPKLVALVLALRGNAIDENICENIYPSVRTLARKASTHRRTVQRILRDFVKSGLLQRMSPGTGYRGAPNPAGKYTTLYALCLEHLPPPRAAQDRPSTADQGRHNVRTRAAIDTRQGRSHAARSTHRSTLDQPFRAKETRAERERRDALDRLSFKG